eukprot:m51a1_g14035 hypothetical protein (95) ;mRNA; r:1164227-1164511
MRCADDRAAAVVRAAKALADAEAELAAATVAADMAAAALHVARERREEYSMTCIDQQLLGSLVEDVLAAGARLDSARRSEQDARDALGRCSQPP